LSVSLHGTDGKDDFHMHVLQSPLCEAKHQNTLYRR
jgi:hypothetical protein